MKTDSEKKLKISNLEDQLVEKNKYWQITNPFIYFKIDKL
jgi:hypothetical protein